MSQSQKDILASPSGGGDDLKKKRRSVNWDPDDLDDNDGIPSKGDVTEGGFEISQWPSADAIAEKRRSSMNMQRPSKLSTKLKRCCSKRRIPINGVLEGPMLEIDTGIHPIDYFSSYSGSIQAKATAIVGWDGKTSYTYEELNCYSDHFAAVLKQLVEEQLKLEYYETLEDYEPCVGVALKPSEKCVITILAIWKLGLAYLPLRTSTDPQMRITGIIHAMKPLLVIGMSEDEVLPHMTSDGWRAVTFEHFWDQVKGKKSILSTAERSELVVSSLSSAFAHSPQSMCSAILHRINSRAEVMPVFIRNATIWNRVYAEWTHFPYDSDENVAIYSSVDSTEFLGQMLTPLLAGKRIISIDMHDMYGLVERVEKWKIMRLTAFPQLVYAIICTMVVIKMKSTEENPGTSLDSVKYWFCTGGSLRRALAVQFFKNVHPGTWLVNLFGCMETLDFVSFQAFKSIKDIKSCLYYKIIPMGSPVINTKLYIVDANGKMMTGSGTGELYISGLSVTSNPDKMQSIMLDDGPTIRLNPFFNEAKDNSMFKMVVKTRDFARMVYNVNNRGESCCPRKQVVTTVFSGHTEGTSIMENYRVNTNEIIAYLKRCPGVKGCHVMVYRPGTNSKMILAFIVMSIKNPVTKDEVYKYLQARIPGYMMPTLIFIPGIPVKNFKINTNTLVEYFHKDRINKNQATTYVELGFQPRELKAVDSLMKILYYYCGSNKRWVASHMNFTLDELRIPYTRTSKVLIELTRRGYKIEMQEFFRLNTPQEILDLMMKRSPAPLINGQIFDKANNYKAEVIDGKHRKEVMDLFINGNCGVQYTYSIAYYSGMREDDMEHVIKHIWPLLVQKKFGVTVRCNKTKKLVAALLNCDHMDKTKFKPWAGIDYPSKYRMEMIDQMDLLLEERGLINKANQLDSLQTLFLVYDPKKTNWDYRHNIDIFQTMLAKALELARGAGFKSMYLMVFDHVSEEFVVDLFGFEVIEVMHVNQFESSDGVLPFHLVPDYVCGTVLYKKL